MRFAADLHLHSRHSSAVSPAMTLEAIALWARRKGIDLIGSADCLQPAWLKNLEEKLVEAEPGIFQLEPKRDEEIVQTLPVKLRAPLRFVLSTEVHCAPLGTPDLGGIHHLIYFRSFASAWKLQRQLTKFGNLEEGRPRLDLTSRQLLEIVSELADDGVLAPAHVFNPFFSTFGTLSGGHSLLDTFGDLSPLITLVETGLTSTPAMCRRLSTLDRSALWSSSDAHSLENIGRECTLVDCERGFDPLFQALRGAGPGVVVRTIKYPIECTRYYRNRCLECKRSFDGKTCPQCGSKLVMGARDRLEVIADRSEPRLGRNAPPWQMLLPLRDVLAEQFGTSREAGGVKDHYNRLLEKLGSERFILTEASEQMLTAAATRSLARSIMEQRIHPPGALKTSEASPSVENQMSLFETGALQSKTGAESSRLKKILADDAGSE